MKEIYTKDMLPGIEFSYSSRKYKIERLNEDDSTCVISWNKAGSNEAGSNDNYETHIAIKNLSIGTFEHLNKQNTNTYPIF